MSARTVLCCILGDVKTIRSCVCRDIERDVNIVQCLGLELICSEREVMAAYQSINITVADNKLHDNTSRGPALRLHLQLRQSYTNAN